MLGTLENNSLLKSIHCIYSIRNGLMNSHFAKDGELDDDLLYISNFLGIEKPTAIVIAILFCEQLQGEAVSLRTIIKTTGLDPMDCLTINNNILYLKKMGLITHSSKLKRDHSGEFYELPRKVMDAIVYNDPKRLQEKLVTNLSEALISIAKIIYDRSNILPADEFFDCVISHSYSYKHYSFIDQILSNTELNSLSKTLLFSMCAEYIIHGTQSFSYNQTTSLFFQDKFEAYQYDRKLENNNPLFRENYLTRPKSYHADIDIIELSDIIIQQLLPTSVRIKKFSPKNTSVIEPESIPDKNLFFNENNRRAIDNLSQLLSHEKYQDLISRMIQNQMVPGVNILLYGPSGTGKTELVYQLARQHNRAILMVDISSVKSMWIGESEKNLKMIFTEYKDSLEYYNKPPFLLFNEADAILSKRNVVITAADQTYNALQNVLLNELENFRGICICTTNIIDNLDKAFDRRLLFKVKFDNPDEATRMKILEDQFSGLPQDILDEINRSELTGGQLQNIKKKTLVDQMLKRDINLELLKDYIIEETFFRCKNKNKIGFKNT